MDSPLSRPVKLTVFFDQELKTGGGYQQGLNALMLTAQIPTELATLQYVTNIKANIKILNEYGVKSNYLNISNLNKFSLAIRRLISNRQLLRIFTNIFGDNVFERYLKKTNTDLVYFISPNYLAKDLDGINYIFTVWDLCHRDHPEFSEVRKTKEIERRDKLLLTTLPKATAVVVDSKLGADNLAQRYGVDKIRIHVIPFSPAQGVSQAIQKTGTGSNSIHEKYNFDVPYVFYPAQFWAHKNHIYLLQGLRVLEQRYGHKIGAILTGTDKGNLKYVEAKAKELGLIDRIRFPGFVSNEEIPELYRQSVALVMPTYFGPTNLPPLEAFSLEVPVLYSDLPGLRDQVGNAALLMDLTNPESMAIHLANLLKDPTLRTQLTQAGLERLEKDPPARSLETLIGIIENFKHKKNCWKG